MIHHMIKVEHLSTQNKIEVDMTYETPHEKITSTIKSLSPLLNKDRNNNLSG